MMDNSLMNTSVKPSPRARRPLSIVAASASPMTTHFLVGAHLGSRTSSNRLPVLASVGATPSSFGASLASAGGAPGSVRDRDRRVSQIPSACPSHANAPRCDFRISFISEKGAARRGLPTTPVGRIRTPIEWEAAIRRAASPRSHSSPFPFVRVPLATVTHRVERMAAWRGFPLWRR